MLEGIKHDVGSRVFSCLYQGNPSAASGNIFQRSWFQTYNQRPQFTRIVQSWDCASKTGVANDYSVGSTWGVTSNGYYLLSVVRKRMEFTELKHTIGALAEEWRPDTILIEDSSAGSSVIQELKSSTTFPVIAVPVDKSKVSRAEAVSPTFEAGKIFLPEGASWLNDVMDELAGFPNAAHDDVVDSFTLFLNYMRGDADVELPMVQVYKKIAQRVAAGLDYFISKPKPAPPPVAHPAGSSKPAPLPPELCPICKTPCSIRIGSAGHPPRCVNCGTLHNGGVIVSRPASGCVCLVPRMEARRLTPAGVRCDDCGEYLTNTATDGGRYPVNGISRAQYQSGAYGRRRRWS